MPTRSAHVHVTLYGIASRTADDVDEWRLTRDEAERVLATILVDEPDFADDLYVATVALAVSLN
jgi:hypothetical protein